MHIKAIMKTEVSLALLTFWIVVADCLKCYKCLKGVGPCSDSEVEVCKSDQDSCFFELKSFVGLTSYIAKQGCGSSNYCRYYHGGSKGNLFWKMYCCSTDLCSPVKPSDSTEETNDLECQSCIGSETECGLNAPTKPCFFQKDRCVQISQRFLPGEELEPIIKGCGFNSTVDMQVVYQIGSHFAYIDQKVCNSSNCNNRTFQEIPPGDPNGLECYTCQDLGHGECARDKLRVLKCTGVMDHCVHVMKKDNQSLTIHRGCGTESMCSTYLQIYSGLNRLDSFAECCKTSFCNRADGPSVPESLLGMVALALSLALMAWK